MMFTPASGTVEIYNGPVCWERQGPCLTYRGSVHGWRCSACIQNYLDSSAARADAADRRTRERLARKQMSFQR